MPSGDLSWGDLAGLRQLFGSVAYIPNVEADPRRKLPGGQSSPQSLRGMASIVCGYGKVRVDGIFTHRWLYLLQCILRHRSQLDAEAMTVPFSERYVSRCCTFALARRWCAVDASVRSIWYTDSRSSVLTHTRPAPRSSTHPSSFIVHITHPRFVSVS